MTVSDLSPDALARLEAKLLADLEVVRKVRALLVEHREALGLGSGASAGGPAIVARPESVPVPAPASGAVVMGENRAVQPTEVRRPLMEVMGDVLRAMPATGFHLKEFKDGVFRENRIFPKDSTVKSFFNQMIRKGSVVIAKSNKGRTGSLYRTTFPPLPAVEISVDAGGASGGVAPESSGDGEKSSEFGGGA